MHKVAGPDLYRLRATLIREILLLGRRVPVSLLYRKERAHKRSLKLYARVAGPALEGGCGRSGQGGIPEVILVLLCVVAESGLPDVGIEAFSGLILVGSSRAAGLIDHGRAVVRKGRRVNQGETGSDTGDAHVLSFAVLKRC